ncbi:zinc-dependent alcohol dehydrogenase [Tessaracoccus antarcticus]|uniref:Dehydrogenase n=1 Tax=Tessaracoccus antarcticus TaxID=2479848 RepID=A0A3M0GF09_9ACTN|nr:zinc-binding alcohol dehydrogenase [Tessaracoccus antarcticus]RMB60183.1 dehydrogenase [Tessaracoccus antarcticus]
MSTKRSSSGDALEATAFWATGPCRSELRREQVAPPARGEALVRTLYSGISRGTEMLVHRGAVPQRVAHLMRAPFQSGEFPFPVKYGYLSVGVVDQGPPGWPGRRVFCLHPHQDRYVVPVEALTLIPDEVPSERAVLAGSVETAINALWECAPRIGDRVAVVGAGIIGASLAALLRRFPLSRLQLVDPDPAKGAVAEAVGVEWAAPGDAMTHCDIVYHASATEAGLAGGLGQLGEEGDLVELSWYGTDSPAVPLGLDFHARRLRIRASQVGVIAAPRRARRTHADRLSLAFDALTDPVFDALLGGASSFAELPEVMESMCQGSLPGMCRIIAYPGTPSHTKRG